MVAGGPVQVARRLVGHYCKLKLDSTGRGSIQQDPYGLHPLYFAEVHGTFLISNRPHPIAAEWEQITGELPSRDHCLAAWLTLAAYPIGNRTGYECVRTVPFGCDVRVRSDYTVQFRPTRPPWVYSQPFSTSDLIDRIECELIENLNAIVSSAPHRPVLQLTGGRDSRLVLSLAVRAKLMRDLTIVTHGPPSTPDALIARQLTRGLDVRHTQVAWRNSVATNLCSHVRQVAGMLNCIDSSISPVGDDTTLLSGFVGETLRSTWSYRYAGHADVRSVTYGYLSSFRRVTGILQRCGYARALLYGLECMLASSMEGARPEDMFDVFSVQHRIRRRISARPDRFSKEFFPLYYPPAVDFAFRQGWRPRTVGYIHNELISRAGPPMSVLEYCKPGGLYRVDHVSSANRRVNPSISWRLFGTYLRQRTSVKWAGLWCDAGGVPQKAIREAVDEVYSALWPLPLKTTKRAGSGRRTNRQALYEALIHARECNPAFEDVLDRDRLVDAVSRLPDLTDSAARQVHAAMTAVVWLGRLENEECV